MKAISLTLIYTLLVALLPGCLNNINCSVFKTGNFSYYSKVTQLKYYFSRNDSTQTETHPITGKTSTFKITWPGPCEYVLYPIGNLTANSDGIDSFFNAKPINFSILKSTSSYYIFRTQIDSTGKTMYVTDTIFVEH